MLLVDGIIQLVIDLVHTRTLVAQVLDFGFLHQSLVRRIGKNLQQAGMFRKAAVRTQQEYAGFIKFIFLDQLLGLRNNLADVPLLGIDESLNFRLHLVEPVILDRGRAADDERCTGFVDQYRIDFVNDGVVVLTVDQVNFVDHHVVTEIVEAELVVCSICDVAAVLLAALEGIHGILDAANREAEKFIDLPHPDAVALGEIIVHRHNMDAAGRKGIQISGHRCDKGLTFTCSHLGYSSLVQDDASDQLDIEGDHFPRDLVAHQIKLRAAEAPAGVFHRGKCLGEKFIECIRGDVVPLLFQLFKLVGDLLAFGPLERREPGLCCFDFREDIFDCLGDAPAELGGFALQLVVGELLIFLVVAVDFLDKRQHSLDVFFMLAAKDLLKYSQHYPTCCVCSKNSSKYREKSEYLQGTYQRLFGPFHFYFHTFFEIVMSMTKHVVHVICIAAIVLLGGCSSSRKQQRAQEETPQPVTSPLPNEAEIEPLFSTPSPLTAISSSPYLNIKAKIDSLIPDSLFPPAHIGLKVLSLRTGETLYEINAHSLFNPASNQKIYTSATALSLLGEKFNVKTVASVDTNTNTIFLKGYGDGVFSTENLDSLAGLVHRAIPPARTWRVAGDISYFDNEYWGYGWNWDDEPEAYQMFLTPLSLNGNTIRLRAKPGRRPGDSLIVWTEPATDFVTIENKAVTAGGDITNPLKLSRRWRERLNVLTVEGEMRVSDTGASNDLSLWQPERYAVHLFGELLRKRGVMVGATAIDTVSPQAFEVARYEHPLDSLVTYLNKVSDNLTAETVLKILAAEKNGPPGSAETGAHVVKELLAEIGIDTLQLRIVDGSGLSRMNLVSPDATVKLLEAMYKSAAFDAFYKSLPIAGIDGTIRGRMRRTIAEGNLRAKTGTLSAVTALSGYVQMADGEWLAFSMMMQNYTKPARVYRQVQDRIGIYLGKLRRSAF